MSLKWSRSFIVSLCIFLIAFIKKLQLSLLIVSLIYCLVQSQQLDHFLFFFFFACKPTTVKPLAQPCSLPGSLLTFSVKSIRGWNFFCLSKQFSTVQVYLESFTVLQAISPRLCSMIFDIFDFSAFAITQLHHLMATDICYCALMQVEVYLTSNLDKFHTPTQLHRSQHME